ncbi:MAG: 30S ribosomal protein S2 [Bacteroidetes bacterium RIFCSPLOWO2_12_FULL_31_6]|nr:MAG: 30S ribosomal protein S2 [Bacteroidetes bacterium RIFCSPLOWO2_12_FULL_31_6]
MANVTHQELLEAGVHYGHLRKKWNPGMAPYIFMEKNGIHIIDLNKTIAKLNEATAALKQIAKSGKKILFVATKKQAKDVVADKVKEVNMPYITERWLGGTLTNFHTIRKSIRKMTSMDKMKTDPALLSISKRERLQIQRQTEKMQKLLGSITDLTRLPAALFIIDINKEHIAIQEARRLNIPTFAVVDTNSDPNKVDFPIPANDDATKAILLLITKVTESIQEGLNERKIDKEKVVDKKEEKEVEDDVESIDKKLRKFEDDKEDVVIGSKKINPLKVADKLPVTKRGTGGKRTPYKSGDKK